jgi:tRNA nucleotidyltransferase (CCA-adding enzyme)
MKTYAVGGSVRDELLGLPVTDRDWVVVGATPEAMAASGFRPVGSDFPVFLHPQTHEEYALARTERKTAPGYKGFTFHAAPDVTLEDDLRRRDLTINAMARGEDGALVDPHGGAGDLQRGLLRHVSEAFAEDPVRILRVARFAARFGFAVAPETLALMRQMVRAGEADHLVPERVWQELARGLAEKQPSRMIAVLRECGALARVLPEVEAVMADAALAQHLATRVDIAARDYAPTVQFASLALDLAPKAIEALCARVNVPAECREVALLAARERSSVARADTSAVDERLGILERADAFRRPVRLASLMDTSECDYRAGGGALPFAPRLRLEAARAAAAAIDAGAVARANPADIPGAIRTARLAALVAKG